jgi:Fe-S-cluster formation regulator IscX/YfhJ
VETTDPIATNWAWERRWFCATEEADDNSAGGGEATSEAVDVKVNGKVD